MHFLDSDSKVGGKGDWGRKRGEVARNSEIWGKHSCIWLLILTFPTKQQGIGFTDAGDPE